MRKLQNNFTTPDQSKRLLALGVPAWTADCYYYEEGGISKDCTPNIVPLGEIWEDGSREEMFSSYVDIPCWSVGRLMEITYICDKKKIDIRIMDLCTNPNNTIMQQLIDILEYAIKLNDIDFSKLEE